MMIMTKHLMPYLCGTLLGRKGSLLLLQWIKCEALSSHLDLKHLLTRCILNQAVFVFKMYFEAFLYQLTNTQQILINFSKIENIIDSFVPAKLVLAMVPFPLTAICCLLPILTFEISVLLKFLEQLLVMCHMVSAAPIN